MYVLARYKREVRKGISKRATLHGAVRRLPGRGSFETGSLKMGRADILDMGSIGCLRWWERCCRKDRGCYVSGCPTQEGQEMRHG